MDKLVADIYNDVSAIMKQPLINEEHRMIIDDFMKDDWSFTAIDY